MDVCKECGEPIRWERTKNGKWRPVNLDRSVHFPTCRARVAEGREAVHEWYAELLDEKEEAPQRVGEKQSGNL